MIGVIVSNAANDFFKDVTRAIQDQATKYDFTVLIINSDEDPVKERRQAIKNFLRNYYDVFPVLPLPALMKPLTTQV